MLSTLRLHDVVQLDESAYVSSAIQRGDVVVYRSLKHDNMLLPGRVVGLPNETLELRNGALHVNGLEIPEPYVDGDAAEQPHSRVFGEFLVPNGHVFLLGDFRDMSEDSRFIGPIPKDLIVGRITHAAGQREV
ncbi:signal peptidase I [Pelomonas sp. P7]|uniref:Signal peptidase I n=2 Tax=Pelomonas caseinilytica TaxID=2906763 RepID=A0ABS8XU91_9BURK|nr:signal peptidase I [Pelomonas sp. P7]